MQRLVEAGEITAEEAEVSERRNIILQALGPEAVIKVDLTRQQVRRDDMLVLCSDGLSGQIRTRRHLARGRRKNPISSNVCKQLIDLANENGGPDNITVIAVRFDGAGLNIASAGEGVGHQTYTSQSESRATVPVDLDAVRELDIDAHANTLPKMDHADTLARERYLSSGPMAPLTQPISRAPLPEGRVSKNVLRLIFGTIALALIAYLYLKFRG